MVGGTVGDGSGGTVGRAVGFGDAADGGVDGSAVGTGETTSVGDGLGSSGGVVATGNRTIVSAIPAAANTQTDVTATKATANRPILVS